MRNAKLAIVSKKTNKYTMINKPLIWSIDQESVPEKLFALIISFHPSKPLKREHDSFMLLTRVKIPEFPVFPLFLEDDCETTIRTTALSSQLSVSPDDLSLLSELMFSIFYDVFHKTFDLETSKFPYWIAPVNLTGTSLDAAMRPSGIVDWEAIKFVHENLELKWTKGMSADILLSRLLFDPWDGRKRYYPLAVDQTMSPSDPVPSHLPRRKWMENILNYSLNLGKSSRVKWLENAEWDQPVLQVESVYLRRNFLDRATDTEKKETGKVLVCPQPLRISPVSDLWYFSLKSLILIAFSCLSPWSLRS